MAEEDIARWCLTLDDEELQARPFQLPSVAFQVRHIARSLNRFCTYAEGAALTQEQLDSLSTEMSEPVMHNALFKELDESLIKTKLRLPKIMMTPLEKPLGIGRKQLPTTLGGLLIHAAEHTQRLVGQAITTAKVVVAQRT